METLLHETFKNTFEPALLAELVASRLAEVPAGTELRHEAQSTVRYTPLVLRGTIRVTRVDESGRELLLYNISPRESCFLTISAALNNNFHAVRALRAVTETPVLMVMVADQQVRDWHERYPTWRQFVAQLYGSRFAEFFALVDNVVFKSADQKLIEQLTKLQDARGEVRATHQELAVRMGTAREVVSRLLKALERAGKVALGTGRIRVLQKL